MTHETIKKAIEASDALRRLRSGENLIPAPNYDVVICLYERKTDGTDAENPILAAGDRPQSFATDNHMKYQRFGVMKHHERDGKEYLACFLVHLYWDGSRDEDSARGLILDHSSLLGYGQWEPTAPSDPLKIGDYWSKELGDPPNGYWDDLQNGFVPFNNFERPPYEKIEFSVNVITEA